MISPRFIPLVVKQVVRHRVRSALTVSGVATAVFLFVVIEAMQRGVADATHASAADTTLIVYRKDRFCPFSSRLPEYYGPRIAAIEGVRSVVPMKVVVSNCRASLDVVTFRGVPRDSDMEDVISESRFLNGSVEEWRGRSDAALLGSMLARRRGLKRGDQFQSAGVTAYVAGVFESQQPQDQNTAYVHLDFLQQTVDRRLGIVTQFAVQVDEPERLAAVAEEIDLLFGPAESPTTTRPEKAFVAQAAADMIDLVAFARMLGWGCLLAVLALIGNAIVLSVQGRVRDHAVLQTLGYTSGLIGRLVVAEGVVLGVLGGALGTAAAVWAVRLTQFSLSVDGLSIPIQASAQLAVTGVLVSGALGVVSGLVPAWQVSRREIATCFRAV